MVRAPVAGGACNGDCGQAQENCSCASEQTRDKALMQDPPSPCNGVCRIDETTGWCRGCQRTLDEIADWSMMTRDRKRAVLARLPARRTK
jgi:uncharacterized protein